MADISAGTQIINLQGTVTELATASLFQSSGAGSFSGSNSIYTFDLGSLASDSGMFTLGLGVANGNSGQSFSELLSGNFSFGGATGWTFASSGVSGLAGGSTDIGSLLTFDTTGLTAGNYNGSLTFNGTSQFVGLSDHSLASIRLDFFANIMGGGSSGGGSSGGGSSGGGSSGGGSSGGGSSGGGSSGGVGAVPEPSTWALLVIGMGLVGSAMRRRRASLRIRYS